MYAGTLLDIAMTHADNMIARAKAGDEQANNKLVKLWYKRIYNYAFKYLADHDMAMEVTQRTFITMFRKIAGLQDISRFKPWLYRIASNYCHEEYRNKGRMSSLFIEKEESEGEGGATTLTDFGGAPEIEGQLHQQELSKLLEWALQQLAADQREVIIMKEYEGLKFREIADVLDVPENTVKSRLYYALSHLKKLLDHRKLTKEYLYYEG